LLVFCTPKQVDPRHEKQQSKKTADKGKTAKAETGYHKNFTEWNSYYNHV